MSRIDTGRLALIANGESTHFDICHHTDNRVIGEVILGTSTGEIAVRIDEKDRRMGYGLEAAKAVLWHTLQTLDMDVVRARVAPENEAAVRLLEKLGFVLHADEWRYYHTDFLPGPDWDWRAVARPEKMGAFFDARADGYDAHMFSYGGGSSYAKLGACMPKTAEPIRVLDIGCGTGIELGFIWGKAPNAHVTCVDLSRGMLDLLIANHKECAGRIEVVEASYVTWDYPKEAFDLVISSNTMHHFLEAEKVKIYRKMRATLKPGGAYIESDFIVDPWCEKQYMNRYEAFLAQLGRAPEPGEYHIDLPFTIDRQTRLLREAGFREVSVLDDSVQPRWSGAILKAGR